MTPMDVRRHPEAGRSGSEPVPPRCRLRPPSSPAPRPSPPASCGGPAPAPLLAIDRRARRRGPGPSRPWAHALPRTPRPRELAEAERGRERALVVAGHVVQQALDAPEPEPVGGVAEQPRRDAAPAQRLVDVEFPD